MSIAEKFPELTAEEISMLLIVRANGPGGYDMEEDVGRARDLLYRLKMKGTIRFKTVAVETPAGKAVRP